MRVLGRSGAEEESVIVPDKQTTTDYIATANGPQGHELSQRTLDLNVTRRLLFQMFPSGTSIAVTSCISRMTLNAKEHARTPSCAALHFVRGMSCAVSTAT